MGQTLSEPVTSKETAICQNDFYKVGSSCMQGWRVSMEDSHTHILSLPDDPDVSFFAVFDGHGGANVAKYASKHLHKFVVKRPEYQTDVPSALRQAFLDIDKAMLNDDDLKEQMAGSTAISCMIKDKKLYCANAGDSRAVACKNGQLVLLSNDHKPNNKEEMERIYNAGGWVEFNRVNGNLALSRALGDFIFKRNHKMSAEQQIVTALPEVTVHDISDEWDFLVLACDGIWDVLTNQAVINFVTEMIGEGKYPEDICEELLSFCLAPICQMGGLGGDNMSIIIVCFLHGQPYANLVERCRKHHSEKKATMVNEPFFDATLDRLTADGPFSDVSSLSATGVVNAQSNEANSSSSSPTSSPSSSPRSSTEDKFDALKAEENAEKSSSSLSSRKESTGDNVEEALNSLEEQELCKNDEDEITSSEEQLSKKIKSEAEKKTTEMSSSTTTANSNNNNDNNVSNSE
ncbi:unnamed protein product [Diamesa hyperborea]